MASSEDLISLDVIETHKENIQSLPGGRSVKALASVFSPPVSNNDHLSTGLSETTNINAAIRQGFEAELLSISEADDPLDIYDRYVKWTLDAYPSAQATPQSQLLPLLERATKAFLASPHYKNDPRYLRLWLHYIRLFSDSPKETFAFLARHNVGDGLALFYEEFAAWLESVGRWAQAEEVYRLGIDRDARPVERLARKFAEFQQRFTRVAQTGTGPSSPVLAAVRPALAAKMDPFATSTARTVDPQAQANPSQVSRGLTSGSGRQKLEIFSDADAPPPAVGSETAKGWQNIGSIAHRKKENVMEPKPWAGETLKMGKKVGSAPKMMVFKDEVCFVLIRLSLRMSVMSCSYIYDHRTNYCRQWHCYPSRSRLQIRTRRTNKNLIVHIQRSRQTQEPAELNAYLLTLKQFIISQKMVKRR